MFFTSTAQFPTFASMHVFYAENVAKQQLVLSHEESVHAVRVLRIQPGDNAEILNGRGDRFIGKYEGSHGKQCFFSVIETEKVPPRPVRLTMAVAPPKMIDRFEWFLEKATEIGIERIVPILSRHSERKVIKLERSKKVLIAAMKQSRTTWLPEISEPVLLSDFIKENQSDQSTRYIAHCHSGQLPHLHHDAPSPDVMILIGPEGDFDMDEVQLAKDSGWKEISLGSNRLRTETAALMAVHCVSLKHL